MFGICVDREFPWFPVRQNLIHSCRHVDSPSSSRQLFESSHSVVLSIFAADAEHRLKDPAYQFDFARRLEGLYSRCLIEVNRYLDSLFLIVFLTPFQNSDDDRLSTSQLCLAYGSLMRSVTAGRVASSSTWEPLQALLDAVKASTAAAKKHRLSLALIHCIPNLPPVLMEGVLTEVENIVKEQPDEERREELRKALFDLILDDVGDGEKEVVIRWWFERMDLEKGRDEETAGARL